QHPQEGRPSRAVGPEDGHELSGGQGDVQAREQGPAADVSRDPLGHDRHALRNGARFRLRAVAPATPRPPTARTAPTSSTRHRLDGWLSTFEADAAPGWAVLIGAGD